MFLFGGRGTGEVVGPLLTSDRCGVVFGCFFEGVFSSLGPFLVFVLVGGGLTRWLVPDSPFSLFSLGISTVFMPGVHLRAGVLPGGGDP